MFRFLGAGIKFGVKPVTSGAEPACVGLVNLSRPLPFYRYVFSTPGCKLLEILADDLVIVLQINNVSPSAIHAFRVKVRNFKEHLRHRNLPPARFICRTTVLSYRREGMYPDFSRVSTFRIVSFHQPKRTVLSPVPWYRLGTSV